MAAGDGAGNDRRKRRRSQGEGALFQRASDGLWVGRADLGWVDGKRSRKTVYGKTEKECREKLTKVQRAAELGVNVTAERRTVAVWLGEWLDIKEGDGTRASTLRAYRWLINTHIVPVIGRVQLDKLTPLDVRRLVASAKKSGLSAGSVRHVHSLIRNALAEAERLDLVARNVAKAVKAPPTPHREVRALRPEEARRLVEVLRGERLEAVFACGLMLGLRRGEILGLRWSDVDLDGATLHVRQTLQRVDGSLMFVPAKTERSHRRLPIPPKLMAILRRHRATQTAERTGLGDAWTETGLVFTSSIGTPLEPRNVNRRFDVLRRQAGLPWLRLHDLRHAFASMLFAEGVPARTVMELLGHSTIQLTMNTYTHVMPETRRDAVGRLDRIFSDDAGGAADVDEADGEDLAG
ncbi:site-specific recombinase XerD [Frankia sp. EI5c]|uniref:tyrosine-type recombinase/integrase n=1 Tax=Frankia sp. EI5c TaxID=683316 RepID=UPI0007C22B25|nr:site-specific integrase [Frankia sp. EI5c]OAA21855.1 site-specific recombinase XerD [Frankia sp. EI5c]